MVRAKKYFYVLRPLLAGQWILKTGTPPPMLFSELFKMEFPEELRKEVEKLLEIKVHASEIKEIPRIDKLNEYLENEMKRMKEKAKTLDEEKRSWKKLNKIFLEEI